MFTSLIPAAVASKVFGPYLRALTSESVEIALIRYANSPDTVIVDLGKGKTKKLFFSADTFTSVRVEDLKPDIAYSYVYKGRKHIFRTLPIKGPIQFIAYGDSRSDGNPDGRVKTKGRHLRVIDAMRKLEKPLFILHNGDFARSAIDMASWEEDLFAILLTIMGPEHCVYPAVGNHELDLDTAGAIFDKVFGTVKGKRYYAVRAGNCLIITIDSENRNDSLAQKEWLFNTLWNARTGNEFKWIIAQSHRGLNLLGGHGDAQDWFASYKDIVDAFRVDLFLQGHSHFYQRMYPSYNGVVNDTGTVYVTVGTGGAGTYASKSGDGVAINIDTIGYMRIHAGENSLSAAFVEPDQGNVLDSLSITDQIAPSQPGCITIEQADLSFDRVTLTIHGDISAATLLYLCSPKGENRFLTGMKPLLDGLTEHTRYAYSVKAASHGRVYILKDSLIITTRYDSIRPVITHAFRIDETRSSFVFSKPVDKASLGKREDYLIDKKPAVKVELLDDGKTAMLYHKKVPLKEVTLTINAPITDGTFLKNTLEDGSRSTVLAMPGKFEISGFNRQGYMVLTTLHATDTIFSDRTYTVKTLPEGFSNGFFIMTPFNDKIKSGDAVLEFHTGCPVKVTLFSDNFAPAFAQWQKNAATLEYCGYQGAMETYNARTRYFYSDRVVLPGAATGKMYVIYVEKL
ncbi:MAG: hypothetical protein A2268_12085 [Candidatus Raymondbacteria bacterium RifOxyA12_full_50_37]|uniref:Calcineurin-like phosphoesterase domain-containing protein n=1 Tax=Candidatus Raymondbacteria bacterium RIFOXYD12_FULL_49_13 TaxID=1817890 RepID=A0A1F7F0M1_UNCRA|nr:MAG: hypothetical protein A2268_12085 [Candidatus Raymondbacteria bacterium RifOxyA12_full_50_37]OGJ86057.1 MAG: hypothetical protein A2248_02080 [Candidatus Raymondbacteria bacterium RIFOXYA2_FULL_49_16]OGJ95954.1 MAG: hypothetical protein A2453_05485 [Candidatus Raymondbacteria bacterium RIFOXYC2_FULL_50_21]OGK00199.1 MAG: hypothetical protein A2519_20540 [Candidatus Raymondbacteria bacterium RIFOXYD12_FULL_49_13]OGK03900.1 MAG: hypothetical protein A2350_02445 [Candidatus Raymondbacteria 